MFAVSLTGTAFAQSTKCIGGAKIIYTDGDCPTGTKQESPRDTTKSAPRLPSLQRGLWKFKVNVDGRPSESEHCGDPMAEISETLDTYRAMACAVELSAPDPRTTRAEINCPADRARSDGSARVRKGRGVLTVSVLNSQSFNFEFISKDLNRVERGEGRLSGSC